MLAANEGMLSHGNNCLRPTLLRSRFTLAGAGTAHVVERGCRGSPRTIVTPCGFCRRHFAMKRATRRVLVTGGAGFIGSHLCMRLAAAGCDVICLDNFFTGT